MLLDPTRTTRNPNFLVCQLVLNLVLRSKGTICSPDMPIIWRNRKPKTPCSSRNFSNSLTFCGIALVKPSHRRFSKFSSPGSVPGRSHTYASIGPMATNIKHCVRMLQALWCNDCFYKYDPYVPPINFNKGMYLSKNPLKIGYYVDDGWFKATPAVERAVL
ncbi:unnamed protein product [Bursaphelenchus xylophilus]|uniref:(pine wood nematode) hypothetical protein n=1 Tax=Bursaphelenchus xylophilus TaxID=6326 RepID=A0A1I7RN40_BURXY|nr:unnamed protein product [Bursaphelenchus xylophilus]CAG9086957.1 unnamed protein product [Bursaphelenchus xylophilus]